MKLLLIVAYFLIAAAPALADEKNWKPIDQVKAPVVEHEADAEAIFWDVFVDINSSRVSFSHYIRIKIFTERGRDSQSKVDLLYIGKNKIEDIAGRTIKADGTIIELKKDAIFDRTIVKGKELQIKAKSFAMPAVEPQAIIEYRWREVREDEHFIRLQFQRDIPVQSVKYSLKIPIEFYLHMVTRTFNGENKRFEQEKENLYSRSMTNLPGIREEPDMPPKDQVRTWMLIYFVPYEFGTELNKIMYDEFKSGTKLTDELRKAAATIVANAATPEEKIKLIFEFCRSRIKRVDSEALTDLDRAKYKTNKTATDTLKSEAGTGSDINLLFAALAIATGFEARLAKTPNRDDIFFDARSADAAARLYFMRNSSIVVKLDDKWRFFDPASAFVPYGMLQWNEEGQTALLIGDGMEAFESTPISPPEKSLQKRTAKLRLIEDGTLEGDVRIEYRGHFAAERKAYNAYDSPEQREQTLREEIKQRISIAEVSNVRIENANDMIKPFVCSFHVRVPGYAQRTGKRLLFQPAFFQYGKSPRFSATERKYEVYFRYPWMEQDEVEIDLPVGFVLDRAESIGAYPLANIGKYDVRIGITKDQRILVYKRDFLFGDGGRILFPAGAYQQLKQILDVTHELDNRVITLKQEEANPKN
ncbi:MAG TPA: DUF3857 domain-containing protein [Blastocatellia bacterium]|nr:DUF3857 domain-containing protein [Blastocatellia bacterium]